MPLSAHQAPDFSVLPSLQSPCLNVRITGNASTSRAQKVLEDFLTALHDEVRRLHVEEVVVDIRELEFMNSSCLKDFVYWLSSVRDAPAAERYRIVFFANPKHHWQKRSLHSLTCFASEFVSVEPPVTPTH
jgi:hypothetical protein